MIKITVETTWTDKNDKEITDSVSISRGEFDRDIRLDDLSSIFFDLAIAMGYSLEAVKEIISEG